MGIPLFLASAGMSGYGQQQPPAYNNPQQPGGYNQGPYTPPPAGPVAPALPQQIHIAGIVGGALALLGSVLAWASVDIEGTTETVKGTEVDGLWTLLLSIAVVGLFAAGMVTKKVVLSAAGAAGGLLVLVFAAINIFNPERAVRAKLEDEGAPADQIDAIIEIIDISAGFGIYLVVIGALGAIVAGGIAATKLKK